MALMIPYSVLLCVYFNVNFGLNNIYSDKVHDTHKYNVKIVGSDSKPVAYLDHLLDMLKICILYDGFGQV